MKTLSRAQLKNIAFCAMLCDHLAMVLFPEKEGILWAAMHLFGRISMPLYAFLVSEGLYFTRNRRRYIVRLLALAIISTVPYSLLLYDTWLYAKDLNIVFGLAIGALAVTVTDSIEKKKKTQDPAFRVAILIAACMISVLLRTNYLFVPVLLIYSFYYYRNFDEKKLLYAAVILTAGSFLENAVQICMDGVNSWEEVLRQAINGTEWELTSLLALPLINKYDGSRGRCLPDTVYYLMYPVHMLLLLLIK